MPRARDSNRDRAFEIYKEHGGKIDLVEIASQLSISAGTVRGWKSKDNWDGILNRTLRKNTERSKRKKGGQRGNKNSVDSGAPCGNQNALKHGGYSDVYWDALSDEEKKMLEVIPEKADELLLEQIQLFAIRERRIMHAIKQQKESKDGLYVSGVIKSEDKRMFDTPEDEELYAERIMKKIENGERLPGTRYTTQTSTGAAIDLITRLEKELTSIQSKKTKAIDSLIRLQIEKRKIEDAGVGNELVDDWVSSITAMQKKGGREV